jgi:membrane protease YdiL (CAAX protease family)
MDVPPPSEPPPVRTVPRWRWWLALVLLTGYVLAVGLLALSRPEHQAPVLSRTSIGLLIAAGAELAIFGIVFAVAWFASRPSWDDLLLRWRGGFRVVPLGIAYSIALRLAVAIVMMIISTALIGSGTMTQESLQEFVRANQPRTETIVDPSTMRNDPVYFLLMLTVISFVVAGLREELWRSGFLAGVRALRPALFNSVKGQIAAAAIAAVIFGVGHLAMGWLAAFMAALLGFGLGTIMLLHRSIWPAVIAHGLFDATTFVLLRSIDTSKLLTLSTS